MPQEARPIRCYWGRCTPEPCKEPATLEILGPEPRVFCERHAREWLEERMPEGWEEYGAEDYTRYLEEAVSQLYRWEDETELTLLSEILSGARHYLEYNELRRARSRLIEAGGTPRATEGERDMLAYFEAAAKEFGWTDEPRWVPRVRGWIAAEEQECGERCA